MVIVGYLLAGAIEANGGQCGSWNGYLHCSPEIRAKAWQQQFKARNRNVFGEQRAAQVQREITRKREIAADNKAEAERKARNKVRRDADRSYTSFYQLPDGTWVQNETHVEDDDNHNKRRKY